MRRVLHRRRLASIATTAPSRREQRAVFVSYAREDVEFVRRLHERLRDAGRASYVDFSDIPEWSDDWQADLYAQIDASHSFVVVLSPDSLASPNVARELERALEQRKRLRPLLCRDVDAEGVPPEVGRPQWIDFRDGADFDSSFAELVTALETDVAWVERHTRFLLAANDWKARDEDPSLLLGRSDLRDAEGWLAGQAGKEPPPNELQVRYILASRKAATRRQQVTLGSVVVALAVTAVLAAFALIQRGQAITQRDQARSRELAALSAAQLDADPQQSLRLALRSADAARTAQAESALQQAVARSNLRQTLSPTGVKPSAILAVAVTRDGRFAVTGQSDRLARIWDLHDGRLLATLHGHTAPITNVDVSRDGSLAVTGSGVTSFKNEDGDARIWELPSGRLLHVLRHDATGIGSATFSPDGTRVVTATDVDSLGPGAVWDVRTGKRVVRFRGSDPEIDIAFWSPDGKRLATLDRGNTVTIWNARTGTPIRTFGFGRDNFPVDVSFSPDGRSIAVAGDGIARIVEIAGGRVTRLPGPNSLFDALNAVRFCPSGACVAVASDDDTARIYSAGGRLLRTVRGHTADVTGVSFNTDGRYVLTWSEDGTARVWSRRSGAPLAVFRGHSGDVTGASFLGSGTRVVTTGEDGSVRVWDPGVIVFEENDFVTDATLSPDESRLATASLGGVATLWTSGGKRLHALRPEELSNVDRVVFSPDGKRVLTEASFVTLFSAADGRRIRFFDFDVDYPAFSPDSSLIAAGDLGRVRLFDGRTGRAVGTLPVGKRTAVFRPSFTRDGTLVAAPGALTGAEVWNLRARGRAVHLRTKESIDKTVFASEGHELATAGDSAQVLRLWDVDKRTNVVLDHFPRGVREVAYSPDGRLLAAVSYGERAVRIYDAQTRRRLTELRAENEIFDASFDPSSRLVLTVGNDDRALLWDARSGSLVATVAGHEGTVGAAHFSPDDRSIVTASDDGTAVIHRCDECLPYEQLVELTRRRVAADPD